MKNLTTLILATATLTSFAQNITPRGTGRTTGHIATISIHNTADQPITAFVPPDGDINKIELNSASIFDANQNRGKYFYIPSNGKYQPYVATSASPPPGTAPGHITIPPGDTLHISAIGYCTDIHTPPVPDGGSMPPIAEWIGGDGTIPSPGSGIPDGFSPARNPDDMPFIATNLPNQIPGKPLTTSLDKNPGAVEYLFHALDQITTVYDSLSDEGAISTPFSGNDDKERESVIQQTFWIYTATLTGEPYTKPQFRDRMVAQYEDNSGIKIEAAPQAVADKIEQGVDDFWNTFTAVGVEAKVISVNPGFPDKDKMEKEFGKADLSGVSTKTGDAAATAPPPAKQPAQPVPPPSEERPPSCDCGEFTAEVSFPEINRGKPPVAIKVNPNMQKPATVNITADRSDLHQANTTKLRIENIQLTCACNNAPCPVIPLPDTSPAATAIGAPGAAQAAGQDVPPAPTTTSGAQAQGTSGAEASGSDPNSAAGDAEGDALYKVKLQQNPSQLRLREGQEYEQRTDNKAEYDFERLPLQAGKRTTRVEIEASCATANCPKARCTADIHITLEIR